MRSRLFILAFAVLLGGFSYMALTNGSPESVTTPAAAVEAEDGAVYSMEEVATHNSTEDCWSVVDGGIYDLTEWISRHPGGPKMIEGMCGQDGTTGFMSFHGDDPSASNPLVNMKVGELEG